MGIKVRAIDVGYHGVQRYRKGETFEIQSEKEFSEKWMERIGDSRKAKAKAKAAIVDDEEDEEQAAEDSGKPTGDNEVI